MLFAEGEKRGWWMVNGGWTSAKDGVKNNSGQSFKYV
jgi:hypothetical protein